MDELDSRALTFFAELKYIEAAEVHRKLLKLQKRVLGPEHPETLENWDALADRLALGDQFVEAEAEYRALLKIHQRLHGPEHPGTLSTQFSLADLLRDQGKHAESEAEFRVMLKIQERVHGPEHRDTLGARLGLANALYAHANIWRRRRSIVLRLKSWSVRMALKNQARYQCATK